MLSEAKHLAADGDRPFPFAEFTLERSEGSGLWLAQGDTV